MLCYIVYADDGTVYAVVILRLCIIIDFLLFVFHLGIWPYIYQPCNCGNQSIL